MQGGKSPDMSASQALQQEGITELRMGRPLRKLVQDQATETLKTGAAPDTQIPVIQRALEQVLMGGSKSRTDAENRVSQSGIGRTPQGTRILTDQDFMSALQAAIVPSQVAEGVINRGLGTATATLGPSFGGMGAAAESQARVGAADVGAQGQVLSGLLAALAAAGFAACWVAEELYGPMDLRTWRVRAYLRGRPTWWFTQLYCRVGLRVALQMRRTPAVRAPLRLLFNYLLKSA